EWIEKYERLPQALALPDDCAFLTWDHFGQGASGGARSHIDDFTTYVHDMVCLIARYVEGRPYLLMAHSMGSLISLLGLGRCLIQPLSFIGLAPLLGLPRSPLAPDAAHGIAMVMSLLGFSRRHY